VRIFKDTPVNGPSLMTRIAETAQVKSRASGYRVTKALRDIAHSYGFVRSFRAYLDVARQSDPGDFLTLRREIHCSGVSIVDCPSVSRKDVADKAMIGQFEWAEFQL
jgi:hypothetical protein